MRYLRWVPLWALVLGLDIIIYLVLGRDRPLVLASSVLVVACMAYAEAKK
jgi:hypothetical protein